MTKLKLKLHDLLVAALGGETIDVPATVDVTDLLEFNDVYEYDQDLEDLLAGHRLIAHVWGVEDVRSVRSDLNDDQAWSVLQAIEQGLDGSRGITWDGVEQTASDLFGSGITRRVERCQTALETYDDVPESNLIDFLADALHWCQAKGHAFDALLATARTHFETESPNA